MEKKNYLKAMAKKREDRSPGWNGNLGLGDLFGYGAIDDVYVVT